MKIQLYYFTGTGNSLYVAKEIKSKLNDNAILTPITNDTNYIKSESEMVGIIYPTYDLDAPLIVKQFAGKVVIPEDSYLFLYATSGGMTGNSIYSIKKILAKRDIHIRNSFATTFPDNSIVVSKDRLINEKTLLLAEEKVLNDCMDIVNMSTDITKTNQRISLSNKILGKVLEIMVKYFYQFANIKEDDNCTGCTTCSRVCPINNIQIENNRPVFSNNCEMCLRCIHTCPQKALKYKRMPKKENFQYIHPKIKLNDFFTK